MSRYIVEGGRPLNGSICPSGNKNEALPTLMACLLTDQTVTLRRMPRIGDVLTVCEILQRLGVEVEWLGPDTLQLCAAKADVYSLPAELCAKVRASILFLGPLLSRFGKIELPLPGGDVIGARKIDTHWEGVAALGAKLTFGKAISGTLSRIESTEIFLDEPSVTGTENLLLLAARCPGRVVLHNAACEPHVAGLCNLLSKMGVRIEGIGTNRLTVSGGETLTGADHRLGPDFMEVGSYLCLGAISEGTIRITDVDIGDMRFALKNLERLGIQPQINEDSLLIDDSRPMEIRKDIAGRIPVIYSGPWPSYPTDLMSVAIVAATQAQGSVIFFEKMFEGRMFFTDKLMDMGAEIVLCDPHRVVVNGPSRLIAEKMSSPDVRAGMALLMATLIADGTSEIGNVYQIERGYQDVVEKLESLGAAIRRAD